MCHHSETETVWTFNTARFSVRLDISFDHGYRYDGDDENGETQAALDAGDYVAFDSRVVVMLDDIEIASDSLGGSVYDAGQFAEFFTAHRDRDPMNRNCSAYRKAHGANASVGHYFPSMIAEAIAAARKAISGMPQLRAA